ncbi:MAG: hypothetical protein H7Y15_19745 [Pseudonocardia sp.]|nr:hypothetical protein [Pseudonocardia sp.]
MAAQPCIGADNLAFRIGRTDVAGSTTCDAPADVIHQGSPACADCLVAVFPDVEHQGYPTGAMLAARHDARARNHFRY